MTWSLSEVVHRPKSQSPLHCNTLQHTATHCNTLQHTATLYNTLQHSTTWHDLCQKSCTKLDLSLLYTFILGTCSKFARKSNMLALVVCFPQPCSSAGRVFAADTSWMQYYWTVRLFHKNILNDMHFWLNSTENRRSFEVYLLQPSKKDSVISRFSQN